MGRWRKDGLETVVVRMVGVPAHVQPLALHAVGLVMEQGFRDPVKPGDGFAPMVNGVTFAVERFRKSWNVGIGAQYPVPRPGPAIQPVKADAAADGSGE